MVRKLQRWGLVLGSQILSLSLLWAAATSKGMPDLPSDLALLEARLEQEPTNTMVLIRTALEYHNQAAFGGEGQTKLLKRSKNCLNALLELDPQNTFARTLLGSATVISAREPFWPGAKIRRVREGLALMDAALKENPDDADARFTRASNNLFLPDLFDRKSVVQSDFAWLQERADRGDFAVDFRQYVYLYHGYAQKRWGQKERALQLWEQGLAVDPTTKVAEELRRELSGHSDLAQIKAK